MAVLTLVCHANAKTRVAVIDFDAKAGIKAEMSSLLSDILRSELFGSEPFELINREDMVAILDEVKFQQSGACDSTTCVVQMGQALGAEKMIVGSVGRLGSSYVITIKLVDISTAKNDILFTEYHDGEEKDLRRVIKNVSVKLIDKQMVLSGMVVKKKAASMSKKMVKSLKNKKRVNSKKVKPTKKIGPSERSPIVAGLLGIFPGMGQFYNQQTTKAIVIGAVGIGALVGVIVTSRIAEDARLVYDAGEEGDDFKELVSAFGKKRKTANMLFGITTGIVALSMADSFLSASKTNRSLAMNLDSRTFQVVYAIKF